MFFKQNWCLAVLLLIIILIFSFFSEYRKNVFDTKVAIYEGLQNNDQNDSSNNTVVASSDSTAPVSGECSMVPACYDTVLDDNTLFQSQNNSDKYMLKSQIVPPVCPACPSFFVEIVVSGNNIMEETDVNINVQNNEQTEQVNNETQYNNNNNGTQYNSCLLYTSPSPRD